MKKVMLFSVLIVSFCTQANDCFDMAGRDYKIDPDLLRAISWNESRFKVDAVGQNPVTGYGAGLMQIDSQNFPHLSQFGITPQQLKSDACMNIYTGAYYLALAFKRWGMNWDAVGAYNAGFDKAPRQVERRNNYARKIYNTYISLKSQRQAQR